MFLRNPNAIIADLYQYILPIGIVYTRLNVSILLSVFDGIVYQVDQHLTGLFFVGTHQDRRRVAYSKPFANRRSGASHVAELTLNVSAIVKCVATAVYVRLGVSADTAGRILTLRKLGNSNEINILRIVTQVAGINVHVAGIVPITLAGDFEYKATSATWDSITIEVCGWFV